MRPILLAIACTAVSLLAACSAPDIAERVRAEAEAETARLQTILALWDYGDPAATEQRLRGARQAALAEEDEAFAAELATQVARARGLQRDFEGGHALLDGVDAKLDAQPAGDFTIVRVRSMLERGRLFNTAGDAEAARPLFLGAWNFARASRSDHVAADYLAVDAAHMLGIAAPADEQLAWNRTAIEYAERSDDPDARRWLGALYNNTAWTLHDAGDEEAALDLFERALAFREAELAAGRGDEETVFIARWSVARCLRSLGRADEALAEQRELAAELERAGASPDGFVHEELGELYLLLGDEEAAREQFRLALPLLREIPWVGESDPARLDRIEAFAHSE